MQEMVKLTTQVLESREKEEEEYDEDANEYKDELDRLDDALDIKGKNIEIGKFSNEDLKGDDAVIEGVIITFLVYFLFPYLFFLISFLDG